MKNQSKHYTEIIKEIDTATNFQDLMQIYLDAHYESQHGTLENEDFNFLRIIFNSKFLEFKCDEYIKNSELLTSK